MSYEHTQQGHLDWILVACSLVCAAGAFFTAADPVAFYVLLSIAAACFVLSLTFGSLTVRDEGQRLAVRYGPWPLFRTQVLYEDVTGLRRGRSRLIDGWGIHWVPGRGWTYNLWGMDCVELQLGNRTTRIGTDDPDNLATFLSAKTGLPIE
jgi:hypothetical protein